MGLEVMNLQPSKLWRSSPWCHLCFYPWRSYKEGKASLFILLLLMENRFALFSLNRVQVFYNIPQVFPVMQATCKYSSHQHQTLLPSSLFAHQQIHLQHLISRWFQGGLEITVTFDLYFLLLLQFLLCRSFLPLLLHQLYNQSPQNWDWANAYYCVVQNMP